MSQPRPEAVLQHLHDLGVRGSAHVRGDDEGWTGLEFTVAEATAPLLLECFLASEKGIRADLNAWAAELETHDNAPNYLLLMERVIQTRQWYTLPLPEEPRLEELCESLCRFLAQAMDGVYQMDGKGFYSAEGSLLLGEG